MKSKKSYRHILKKTLNESVAFIYKYRYYSDNQKVDKQGNILNQDFTATGINQK